MSGMHGDKHQAILDAAYTLFGSQGFYETKISQIADKAGIAKGTVYLYFKSKEQLFAAVSQRDFDRFLSRLDHGLHQTKSIQERLGFIADNHLRYYYERRDHTKLFFMAPNNDPDLMRIMEEFLKRYTNAVIEVLEEGGIPEAKLYAKAYIGMLDRLKMEILFDQGFSEADLSKNIAFASHLFIHGCPIT
ncbi:TetR family transcriptional regulator [Paenibacillus sp. CAA11]|uniref:TetR/AcrR family transcriptional regulator n=1 Tax=Paenibacillus sp. CAA11 TaxID=1532905 RepID=UPI000D3DA006|nr:TetR/AcrR family transcriptional regulator [Paenibacillus sp. CAA11]AWB44136.1 TetR family transcriptional regulator [Paenibacillus sp. CAA11]